MEEDVQIKAATLDEIYGADLKNGTGTWTYAECLEFTSYLINRFGLEKVIEVNFNYSEFEEIFGDTLLHLHEQWEKEFLKENY